MSIKKATKASTALMLGTILAMGSRMYEDPMREFQTPVSYGKPKKKRALIPENVEVPIPSGCFEFFFRIDGTYEQVSSEQHKERNDLIKNKNMIFRCIARTSIKAKTKFKNNDNNRTSTSR